MKNQELKSNILLIITAAIWGLAFVAQRVGAQYVGAFTFNCVRFALGGASLLPLLLYLNKTSKGADASKSNEESHKTFSNALLPGIITGCALFLGASLQQIGLQYTTAGKAAFITGLYIAFVPIVGILLKHKVNRSTWGGVGLAVIGLYFLSVTEDFSIGKGDLFEVAGAFFWTFHILCIDHFIKKVDGLKLSFIQTITCSVLSMTVAVIFEDITITGLYKAIIPILYGGIGSVGIAYTLQIIGQKHAKPSHAAIILSMEAVFASIGGIIILKENLGVRGYAGCALMLAGMLLSQLGSFSGEPKEQRLTQ